MATVSILYPSGPDFDLKYYLDIHMPIVVEQWTSFGLQSYEIVVLAPGQKYQIQALLKWDKLSSWETADTSAAAQIVYGDIPKFTLAKPDIFKGDTQGVKSTA